MKCFMLDSNNAFFTGGVGLVQLPTRITRNGDSGWQLYYHGALFSKIICFNDADHGGPYESLQECVRVYLGNVKIPTKKVKKVFQRERASKRHKSGVVGVSFDERKNRWTVSNLLWWRKSIAYESVNDAIEDRLKQERIYAELFGYNIEELKEKLAVKRAKYINEEDLV